MTQKDNSGLRNDLRIFIDDHPAGWNHDDWLELLRSLETKGFGTDEADHIGLELERERVRWGLANLGISGLGPKRREALADRFPTWWTLRHASPDQIAEIESIHRALAEQVAQAVQ